ncbi:MAG: adenylate/guanylate cyclase domain-containing protein [Nitratireductor sp.]|nr:adenylate/guanylate cyclase domain-containing protein [Nitratireductor sp.]
MVTKLFRKKTPYVLAISACVLAASLAFSILRPEILQPVRNLVFDFYQQLKPRQTADSAVVVVDIDEAAIGRFGQWPWPRDQMAELNDRLAAAGALSIAYDMVFSEPDRTSPALIAERLPGSMANRQGMVEMLEKLPDNDAVLAASFAASPVVLAFFDGRGSNDRHARKIAGISWLGEDLSQLLEPLSGAIESLSELVEAASGHGHISLGTAQTDDVVRRVPLFTAAGTDVYPSLALEALRLAVQSATGAPASFLISTTFAGREGGSIEGASGNEVAITEARLGAFVIPTTEDGALNVHFAPNRFTTYLPAGDVLTRPLEELAGVIEGKIVLVGVSAAGLRDIRTTVLREAVPGVAIHAQIIDQIMQGRFLSRPDWAPGAETALAALLSITIIAVLPFIGALTSALFGLVCAGLILAASWTAFSRYGLLIDPLFPLLLAIVTYILTTVLLYAFAERERRFVRTAFQHYLAPDLLTRLTENPDALRLGGEIRDMTLMFMDMRDFTPISEKLTPEELVAFLNRLLSPLSGIIQAHEGAIDKYIGDSIMAFWNAPLDVADHPRKACLAALEMLARVEELNGRDAFGFAGRGLPPVRIGIGINTGQGCVGNMGSASRFDYSVVGDAVNLAARLESASKDAEWPILVSADTARQCPDLALLPAGRLALKGKSEPQEVYALIGSADLARTNEFAALQAAFADLAAARGGKRRAALGHCLSLAPTALHGFIARQA